MREGLKTILQAIDYVKNGISICIFPEGTRNNGEELSMLPFRDGALKIAEKDRVCDHSDQHEQYC